jgi:hypothetical protein
MSSELPVVWWYREVVGMCVEAGPVLAAESVDFLFNWIETYFRHKERSYDHSECVPSLRSLNDSLSVNGLGY